MEVDAERQERVNALEFRKRGSYHRGVTALAGRSRWRRTGRAAGLAFLAVAVVAALVPLRDQVRNSNLALVLVLVVLAAAVIGGRIAGMAVGVAVAIAFDFFLTRPYQSFTIARADDVQTTLLLGAVGLVGGEMVEWGRRNQAEALARRRDLDRIQRRAELTSWGERPGRLIAVSLAELTELLDLVAASYEPGPPPRDMSVLTHDGARVPGGPSVGSPHTVALPVRAHGRDLGHFALVFPDGNVGMSASADRRHTAVALADQLGMALLRYEHG